MAGMAGMASKAAGHARIPSKDCTARVAGTTGIAAMASTYTAEMASMGPCSKNVKQR